MTAKRFDIVAVLPPPLNGMTSVSAALARASDSSARVHAVHRRARMPGPLWTISKHIALSLALIRAAIAGAGRGTCYFVPDSQAGLWLNLVEAPILRLGFSRVILHHHVFSYVTQHDTRMAVILKILGCKTQHITLGPTMARLMQQQYAIKEPIHTLGNAAFIGDTDADTGRPARQALRQISFLGNITSEKGILTALDTVRQAEASGEHFEVEIAGPVKDTRLAHAIASFVAEAPLRRRALGQVQGEAKAAFLARTDVLLFPTAYRNEALPLTIYEALSAGAVVLATPLGCIPDQLTEADGKTRPNWLFEQSAFVKSASDLIVRWRASPSDFAQEAARARSIFESARDRDEQALAQILESLTT